MDATTLIIPIIEALTGLITIYFTLRMNISDQNFYLASIMGILREEGFHRFRLNLWYLMYFSLIAIGVYYAFKRGPSVVTGSFMLTAMQFMTGLLVSYGPFTLLFRAEFWKKPKINFSLLLSILSELVLSISLIIAWYIGYVITLTLSASYLQTVSEPTSGFYALIYVFSFIFLYFAVVFYIISSSLKPTLIWMANALLKSDTGFELKMRVQKKQELCIINWISREGICVKSKDCIILTPWKSLKSLEVIHGSGRSNKKPK